MLNVALQDIDQIGDVIYRDALTESQAIKQARKDYSRVNFIVLAVYDLDKNDIDYSEVIEFSSCNV